MIKFSTHKVVFVRHAAVYGLGTLALRTKEEFAPLFENSLNTLKAALEIQLSEDDHKATFKATQDNCKASIGKIIQAVTDLMLKEGKEAQLKELLTYWVGFFPLKNDPEEATGQHKMLIQLLKNKPDLLITGEQDKEKLKVILQTFAWLCNNDDFVTKEDQQAMKEILTNWIQNANMKSLIESLGLDQKVQDALKEIVN